MLVLGEAVHVISPRVKAAMESRDKKVIQEIALAQIARGAGVVDLNIGPQKKAGAEVMAWMVNTVQEVTDAQLSLDTTNTAAIEAGLKLVRRRAFINSTDATPDRLSALMPLAAKYDANIIALTYAGGSLPTTADARISLAVENIIPICDEFGVSMERVYFDPLVLTINGNQDQVQETINAVRFFKQMSDPPPMTTCGLSNVSNSAPKEMRPLINRVFLVMMHAAGLDSAILDALDAELMETLRIIEKRDDSTAVGKLYLALHDAYSSGSEFDPGVGDLADPAQKDILKTVEVLENKWIYAHSYLKL
ncbi:MAG: dihydropteroate synthase [Dehalococcoidia bacterium]|nr:dihydropteroate synthase [Dehalococcoidia bacterium]